MPRVLFIVTCLLVFFAGAALVAANSGSIHVDLLVAEIELTTGQLMVAAFVMGWLAGIAAAWRFVRRLTSERAALRRNLRLAEAEIKNLRPLPQDRG
ncbi:MAG TPA: LapA family protein [Steroidobacteraceae bacterium]|nr:LapA family protein [Steroidobacteraceae bacterium]